MANELATLIEVKDWMGGNVPSSSDPLLARLIGVAERRIAEVCNRYTSPTQFGFVTGSKVEYLPGDVARSVILRYTPVTAVASAVLVQSSADGTETTTAIDVDRLTVDGYPLGGSAFSAPEGVLAFRSEGSQDILAWEVGDPIAVVRNFWPSGSYPNFGGGYRRVKVTYTGGFATTAIPPTLTQGVIQFVAHLYRSRGQTTVVPSERDSGRDAGRPSDIPQDVYELIRSFVRHV